MPPNRYDFLNAESISLCFPYGQGISCICDQHTVNIVKCFPTTTSSKVTAPSMGNSNGPSRNLVEDLYLMNRNTRLKSTGGNGMTNSLIARNGLLDSSNSHHLGNLMSDGSSGGVEGGKHRYLWTSGLDERTEVILALTFLILIVLGFVSFVIYRCERKHKRCQRSRNNESEDQLRKAHPSSSNCNRSLDDDWLLSRSKMYPPPHNHHHFTASVSVQTDEISPHGKDRFRDVGRFNGVALEEFSMTNSSDISVVDRRLNDCVDGLGEEEDGENNFADHNIEDDSGIINSSTTGQDGRIQRSGTADAAFNNLDIVVKQKGFIAHSSSTPFLLESGVLTDNENIESLEPIYKSINDSHNIFEVDATMMKKFNTINNRNSAKMISTANNDSTPFPSTEHTRNLFETHNNTISNHISVAGGRACNNDHTLLVDTKTYDTLGGHGLSYQHEDEVILDPARYYERRQGEQQKSFLNYDTNIISSNIHKDGNEEEVSETNKDVSYFTYNENAACTRNQMI